MIDLILIILQILLVGIGLAGIILPALPDLPLVFIALALRSFSTNFEQPSIAVLIITLAITLLLYFAEFLAAPAGAKALGSSKNGIIGAILGTILAFFLLPLSFWFVIFAPFLGAVTGEIIGGSTKKQALKVGIGTTLGFFLTATVKLAVAIGFITVLIFSFF